VQGLKGENSITISPQLAGKIGIIFSHQGVLVEASLKNVSNTLRNITLKNGRKQVHIVEHILAALYLSGVTDAIVNISKNVLPSPADSIQPYLEMLEGCVVEINCPEYEWVVTQDDTYSAGDRIVHITHSRKLTLEYYVDFPDHKLSQSYSFTVGQTPVNEIALARPFSPLPNWISLPKFFYTPFLSTFVISDGRGIRNEELYYDGQEPVRHKMIDAIGAIALLQHPVRGRFYFHKSGHAIDVAALRHFVQRGSLELIRAYRSFRACSGRLQTFWSGPFLLTQENTKVFFVFSCFYNIFATILRLTLWQI